MSIKIQHNGTQKFRFNNSPPDLSNILFVLASTYRYSVLKWRSMMTPHCISTIRKNCTMVLFRCALLAVLGTWGFEQGGITKVDTRPTCDERHRHKYFSYQCECRNKSIQTWKEVDTCGHCWCHTKTTPSRGIRVNLLFGAGHIQIPQRATRSYFSSGATHKE